MRARSLELLSPPAPRLTAAVCSFAKPKFVHCLLVVFAALFVNVAAAAEASKSSFDIPEGDAAVTLRQLARQARESVVYPIDLVRGVRTRAVHGQLMAREAAERMTAGTELFVSQDLATGALTIGRLHRSIPDSPYVSPPPQEPMKPRNVLTAVKAWLALALATASTATAADGTSAVGNLRGQIFNPDTGQYVRNAEVQVEGTNVATYSGADGSYVLSGLPAGEAKISVSYTGYESAAATVDVHGGETVVRNFDLTSAKFRSAAPAGSAQGDPIVRLNEFVVSTEREGNAKAIMEQRASLNTKTVVASDNFGDITGGHVGEFIKYLPGVVMDTDDYGEPSLARLGGLDPKYAGVTIDGMQVANGGKAAGLTDTARQFDFNLISITGVESIEVNKTSTASMDADSPAGAINMRSRNAFERKGREITVQTSLSANSYALSLRKTPGPSNESKTFKILPGVIFSFTDVYGGRLGLQFSLASSGTFTYRNEVTSTYNYTVPARGPLITTLVFQEAPKVTERSSLNAGLDFKLLPSLIFSYGVAASHLHAQYGNYSFRFVANPAQIDSSSTLTRIVANPTANINTRVETFGQQNDEYYNTVTHTAKLELKRGDLTATMGGGYSLSRTHIEDVKNGLFQTVNMRVTRMGWMAERSSPTSTDWHMTQLAGRSWSDITSYNRDDPFERHINSNPRSSQNQIFSGYLDVKKTLHFGHPITLQAGVKTRLTTFDKKGHDFMRTYVGPTGSQLDPSAVLVREPFYQIDTRQGGNVSSLGLPSVNRAAVYRLYAEHPEYFREDVYANTLSEVSGSVSSIKEQVDSSYVEATTKRGKLRLNAGLRHERTRTVPRTIDIRPASVVRAAGFTPNTIPFVLYQYRDGQRTTKYGEYQNSFWSGGAKYSFTKSLVLHLSGSQSIGRPNYNQLAGNITFDDVNQIVDIPNPKLKPETSDKYFAGLQYYLEPSGVLSFSVYQLQVKNMGAARSPISAEEAGYANDPDYASYTFLQTVNLDGTRKINGVELEYSQQLVFLPGIWRGLSVFGSLTRVASDIKVPGLVPKAANSGIRFSNHKFNVQLRSTWQASSAISIGAAQTLWWHERLSFDLSGGYKLSRTYEITLSGRNISNAPKRSYSNEPGQLARSIYMGAVWTLGVRGRF